MCNYRAKPRLDPELAVLGARVHVPDWRAGHVIGWTNGTITQVRGIEIDPSGVFIVRLDSTGKEALYCGYSLAPVLEEQPPLPGLGAAIGPLPGPTSPTHPDPVPLDALYDLQRNDPYGGLVEPTEADYTAFQTWAMRKYGIDVWEQYSRTNWMPDTSN